MGRPPKEQQETSSLHKVESFNGEEITSDMDSISTSGLRMGMADKLMSMSNALKILPPNMLKNGRHERHNIEAICGFTVTDEMLDEAYKNFTHPTY